MKKILLLLVAAAVAFGMMLPAFADDGSAAPVGLSVSTITQTKDGGTPAFCGTHIAPASLKTGDQITWRFPANNFNWNPADGVKNAALLTDATWIRLNGAALGSDFTAAYTTPAGNTGEVAVTLTALRAGTYPSLSVSLQGGGGPAVSSAPMQVSVTSSGAGKISGIADTARLGGSGATLNGRAITYDSLSYLIVNNSDELLLPLTAGFFTWDGVAPQPWEPVSTAQLNTGKIKVSSTSRKGSKAFEKSEAEIVNRNGQAHVRIKFSETTTSTKDIDFSILVYLTVNKTRHTGSQIEISGTLEQDVIEVNRDTDYIDISDGSVIEADESVRSIEVYIGAGVSIHTNLSQNRLYYGKAEFYISSADEDLLDKYPSIEEVIVLSVHNLDRGNPKVSFDMSNDRYYVYDKDGKYLGRSNQKLAFSTKYYFSTKEIDFGDTVLPDDDWGWDDPLPNGNDNDAPIQNKNANPYTGR